MSWASVCRCRLWLRVGNHLKPSMLRENPDVARYAYSCRLRKVPPHQGGFLLDGGVHFTAGLRLLMGPENPLVSLSAYTTQLQEHLPPVDTIDVTAKAKNGATGTISISFGTTLSGSEWTVAC